MSSDSVFKARDGLRRAAPQGIGNVVDAEVSVKDILQSQVTFLALTESVTSRRRPEPPS